MKPLEALLPGAGAGLPLSPALRERYGGDLVIGSGAVYANFVSSIDGVVALGVEGVSSGIAISGRNEGDRFVMGLLRACAACVVVGAQTVRDDSGHLWTPAYIHPPSAAEFAALRAALKLPPEPVLVVVTRSGALDPKERAFEQGALVLAPTEVAVDLRRRLPGATEVVALPGASGVDAGAAMAQLRSRFGGTRILTEGGPQIIGWLLAAGLLDELFLTVSPVLAGRNGHSRPGLVAGLELLPDAGRWAQLRSLRRQGNHLFLHYGGLG